MESHAEKEVGKMKDNPEALRKVIDDYLEGRDVPYDPPLFALSTALSHVPGDDAFFIGVVKKLDELSEQNPEGYSYRGRIAHDQGNVFRAELNGHYTPENLADFQSRIKKMNPRQRRGFLDSMYAGLVHAIEDTKENWKPYEHGIREFHGHPEVIAQLNPAFVEQFAGLLDKYGFSNHAEKLRGYETRQLEQAQKNIELRFKSLEHWHGKASAMGRIDDQDFLKRVVSGVPANLEFGYQSPQAIATGKITDPAYLAKVAETYKDTFIVEAAQRSR
ncbi:hypothetical protein GF327_08140 [Candidatus Woesearchaeota archaeon]|nr:hypothetical protein [Candidatus Woesearchaeota archaeon]